MNSVLSVCLLASLSLYCLLLTGEGQFVPGRCECYDTKTTVRGPLSDFKVILKGFACSTDQIIVVMKKTSEPVCVNPTGPLGKQLLRCWNKTIRRGDKKRCLRRWRGQGKQGQRQRKLKGQSKESKGRATPIPALG
uniref:Chemokine interleukin-8-like domain-containing protein n=1 Tax=Hucho hucho TaxID=62062 RepID=A0A4W5LX67_9TELE